jgi:hypothetical protein
MKSKHQHVDIGLATLCLRSIGQTTSIAVLLGRHASRTIARCNELTREAAQQRDITNMSRIAKKGERRIYRG